MSSISEAVRRLINGVLSDLRCFWIRLVKPIRPIASKIGSGMLNRMRLFISQLGVRTKNMLEDMSQEVR